MEQLSLVHEDIYHALRDACAAVGGIKAMAAVLYPNQPLQKAITRLTNELNPDRRDVLHPEDMLALMRHARQRGCHIPMTYLARELDYSMPEPREPKDRADELTREYIEAVKKLETITKQMGHITGRIGPGVMVR